MVKKIILITTVLLCNISLTSERNKSPKPFVTLGAFLRTSKPITMNQLIDETKALQISQFDNLSDEITRYQQLEKNYETFCANLKSRGQKEQHDKFKNHALQCRAKINELVEQELVNLDDQIYKIITDTTLGEKPYRWVAARPLYVKILEIAPKDSEQCKEAQKTLEYIDTKKQPIVDQLDLIKKLKTENNPQGMITAYQTLLLLTPENTQAINSRIVELRSQVAKETSLAEVTCCIAAISTEEASKQARLEKIVDYCNRTIASTSSADVKALCENERLHYKKALTHLELESTPSLCANELINTAYVTMIQHSDSIGLNDVRAMIRKERESTVTNENSSSLTMSIAELESATQRAINNCENLLSASQTNKDKAVAVALAQAGKNKTSSNLVTLANAYHERAEFNQRYYSDKCAALIARDRYDANSAGLQAFNKDKNARAQLKFQL